MRDIIHKGYVLWIKSTLIKLYKLLIIHLRKPKVKYVIRQGIFVPFFKFMFGTTASPKSREHQGLKIPGWVEEKMRFGRRRHRSFHSSAAQPASKVSQSCPSASARRPRIFPPERRLPPPSYSSSSSSAKDCRGLYHKIYDMGEPQIFLHTVWFIRDSVKICLGVSQ